MNRYLYFLLMCCCVFAQSKIKMSKTPATTNLIKIDEKLTIDGGDEGFYSSITAHYYQSHFYVYDRGNKIMFVYDLEGNEIRSFGKEGNGPGEFTQFANLAMVSNNLIIMNQWDRIALYSLDGQHINDIKIQAYSYRLEFENDQIRFYPKIGKNLDGFLYSLQGKKLKTFPKKKEEKETKREIFNLSDTNAMIKRFIEPTDWLKYGDHFIRVSRLDYQIEFGKENGEIIKTITRPFDRVPLVLDENWKIVSVGDKKQDKALNDQYRDKFIEAKDGFESDIERLLGYYDSYLLVQIVNAKSDNHMTIDVISKDDKLASQIRIPIPSDNGKTKRIRLNDDYLICHFKNDEIGPYAKVYKLSM